MENQRAKLFLEKLRQLPHFDFAQEVTNLATRHGDSVALVQAIVEEKFLPKDDACRH